MPDHHHRAGGLRQSNKKNKRSKSSKRSVARAAGGKVMGGKAGAAQAMAQQSKADRRNLAQQKRNAKRQELLRKNRGLDGLPPPPRVVGIVSLGSNQAIEDGLRDFILQGADRVVKPHAANEKATITCKFDTHKKDGTLTLLTCQSAFAARDNDGGKDGAVLAALDLARVCDLILMVIDGNGPSLGSDITEIRFGGNDDDASVSTTKKSKVGGQDWEHLISERGDRILTALKSQGLPTPLTVLAHTVKDTLDDDGEDYMTMQSMKSLRRSRVKRQLDLKKYVSRFATTEFGSGNDKVIEVDLSSMNDNDLQDMDDGTLNNEKKVACAALVRTICSMAATPSKWVAQSPRPFVLSDTYRYDDLHQELHLTGFVRGPVPLDVNSLVHVPGIGTFPCKCIRKQDQPMARKKGDESMNTTSKETTVFSDPQLRESTEMFAVPDALDGEQNLIGFDEADDEDDGKEDDEDGKFARPAGWSDYQSAWLDAVDQDANEDAADHGELANDLNKKPSRSDGASTAPVDAMDLEDANQVSATERQSLLEQRRKEQTEHQDFPDEVQVDEDVKARERFARYRSLKSFRKSYWDPKESLPKSYSTLYHFRSFKATQRAVKNDMKEVVRAAEMMHGNFWGSSPKLFSAMLDDGNSNDENDDDDDILRGFVPSGSYVTLTLEGVPTSSVPTSSSSLLTAVSLLEHENKVSVLHMGLSSSSSSNINQAAIKSKDTLVFRCGWRTWRARPVFSQHNLNCDKHKFERFLPLGGAFFAASVFGPVTYAPCPVLVFRETTTTTAATTTTIDGIMKQEQATAASTTTQELVAVGSMIGADADRIVVKRIILTGYPVRVHKRHATVKYMFTDPDDVKWFKPAGLYTKHGLEGNIMESVGEHGTMKCLFNAPIKQHDTVCLPLYKRIFPKFAATVSDSDDAGDAKPRLVVR